MSTVVLLPPDPAVSVTGITVEGGALVPDSATHRRIYHGARGYRYSDVAVTVAHRHNTVAPSSADYQAGAIARRLDAANYLFAYASATGFFLAKFDGGVRTELAPFVGITALTANTDYWVRLICEGNSLRAEHWTTEPTPMGAPAAVLTATLAGADIAKFGAGIEGQAGIFWTPGASFPNARITEFRARPFTYRNRTLPDRIQLGGNVPGDAPARCDVEVTPSGGAAPPVFGLLAWASRPRAGVAPFGVIEAESAGGLAGWAAEVDGFARGGSRLNDAAPASTKSYSASWTVDPTLLSRHGEWEVEVWARVLLSNTLVTPRLALSAQPLGGADFGATRYTEFGSAGKLLVIPTAGVWRFAYLGRLALSQAGDAYKLLATGTLGAGSGGTMWGLDYLVLVPAGARARSQAGVPLDANYTRFVRSTAETTRTVLADLTSRTAKPPGPSVGDAALTGQRIELEPGASDLLVKLSSLVPDDPSASGASEQLAHSATVRCKVLPRFHYA